MIDLEQEFPDIDSLIPAVPDETDASASSAKSPIGLSASGKSAKISVTALIAATLLAQALGRRAMNRMRRDGAPFLVIVAVPDATWFDPLRQVAKHLLRAAAIHVWDSTARRNSGDPSINEVVGQINRGHAVLCVSQDPVAAMPAAVRTIADVHVSLAPPTADEIALVIGLVRNGRGPTRVPPDLGRGLTLQEVAACLRAADAPRATVARIRRTMTRKGHVLVDLSAPRLSELSGYGDAADWGERVVRDVAEFRKGRLAWRDVAGPAVLHGPPGTGKTLFSRALARSLDAPLVATSVGSWFRVGAGDLGSTVRTATAAFEEARAAVRACGVVVLFVDEIDGLPDRSALDADRGSWWRPVVNHVLTLVDGATSDLNGILLIAATNDISVVDGALLRPGRFGTRLRVNPPSIDDLAQVMRHHLGGTACPLDATQIAAVLRPLAGATQARAAAWAAEAARLARESDRPVQLDDIMKAALPEERRPGRELRRAAIHEAGHAVAAWHLARDRLVSVSLVGSGDSGGRMEMRGFEESLLTRDEIESEVVIVLCGRAADACIGDGAHAGAGSTGHRSSTSDLGLATMLLTSVHGTLGLGPTLRHRGNLRRLEGADEEVASLVEADLQRLMARAETVVSGHAGEIEAVAAALVKRRFLAAADVEAIVATA